MSNWVGAAAGHFLMECVQTYDAVRLLGRPTQWSRIGSFAALQALATVVLTHVMPLVELRFLLLSVSSLVFFMWVFNVGMFPDALFGYLIPHSLHAIGRAIFLPLFAYRFPQMLETPWSAWAGWLSDDLTAYLPSLILAAFFLLTETSETGQGVQNSGRPRYFGWFLIFLSMVISSYQTSAALKSATHPDGHYLSVLGLRLVVFPILVFILHQSSQREAKNEKVLQFHLRRSSIQEAALQTMREERHDLLNELTLISTYVQLGKTEEALQAIAYSAAKLSDRHNYATLPADAWSTVLRVKQAEAQRLGIEFSLAVEAEPPEDFHEQRLLPKVIMNLVDNAFAAVMQQKEPWVRLSWSVDAYGRRLLAVSNNGPEISALDRRRIFRAGVTSKQDPSGNHGWGLVICNRIAEELGGTLTVTSSPDLTVFTLALPPAQRQEQLPAT